MAGEEKTGLRMIGEKKSKIYCILNKLMLISGNFYHGHDTNGSKYVTSYTVYRYYDMRVKTMMQIFEHMSNK